jgi:hypothetical protein
MCLVLMKLSGCKLLAPQWAQAAFVCMPLCTLPYMSDNPSSVATENGHFTLNNSPMISLEYGSEVTTPAWTQFQSHSVRFGSLRFASVRFGSVCFASLRWETSKLSSSAVFSDLEISVDPDSQRLSTWTDQKPMNLAVPVYSAYVSASAWHAEKHCLWQSAAILETKYAPQ